MAFFTTVNINVPVVPRETLEKEDRAAEDFFQDDRIGEEVWRDAAVVSVLNFSFAEQTAASQYRWGRKV